MGLRLSHGAALMLRPIIMGLVIALNLIHPAIHGSFLDGGALDAVLGQLDLIAAYVGNGGI